MLHKDLVGADLHVTKLHAPTHLVGGTDPLGLAESEITGLVTDLGGKAPTVHTHVKADITDFPSLGTAAALNVDADIATLALPANTTISAAGQALIDDANAAAQLATLGTAAYSEGTWTPVLNGFTVVGAAPAVSGTYKRIGNLVFVNCVINAGAEGNTSIASPSSSNIAGLPFTTANTSVALFADLWTALLGAGIISGLLINAPLFSADTHLIYISGSYGC